MVTRIIPSFQDARDADQAEAYLTVQATRPDATSAQAEQLCTVVEQVAAVLAEGGGVLSKQTLGRCKLPQQVDLFCNAVDGAAELLAAPRALPTH